MIKLNYKYKDLLVEVEAEDWESVAKVYFNGEVTNLEYLGYYLPYLEDTLPFVKFPYDQKAKLFDLVYWDVIDDDYWFSSTSRTSSDWKEIEVDYLSPINPILYQLDEFMLSWGFEKEILIEDLDEDD